MGCETATLKLRGWGRALPVLKPGGGVTRSAGGGVILTVGEVETVRLPLRTELLFPPLRHDTAESDLDGEELAFVLVPLTLPKPPVGNGLPSGVPPLITVVWPGAGGGLCSPASAASLLDGVTQERERLPNLPPSAALIGTWLSLLTPS